MRGREKEKPKTSLFDPRSFVGQNSSGQGLKFHRLDKGYAWVPKMRDFTKDSKEDIWGKSKFSGLGGVLKTSFDSTTLQEIGVLPTLVYFQPWGCFKGVWLC